MAVDLKSCSVVRPLFEFSFLPSSQREGHQILQMGKDACLSTFFKLPWIHLSTFYRKLILGYIVLINFEIFPKFETFSKILVNVFNFSDFL